VPYPNLGSGEFTVGSNKKVRFALGNLQYQASTGTWRFAQNQWTVIGNAAGNNTPSANRSTQSEWIDLFGYGTSGVNYNPWIINSHSRNNLSVYAQGNINNSENDWGVNEISNGGNQPNKWRTLTQSEWYYLFNTRSNSDHLHIAKPRTAVHGVKGMIILPDDFPYWTYESNWNWNWNSSLTNAQWNEVAALGAVFIPRSGYRHGSTVAEVTDYGNYWTSSWSSRDGKPMTLRFQDGESTDVSAGDYFNNTRGNAVRLVRDVN